jgi:hypothetical protein
MRNLSELPINLVTTEGPKLLSGPDQTVRSGLLPSTLGARRRYRYRGRGRR